ncbi:MAG: M3 family metallopeptidase [Gammaproteobacteria bacterium]|nr:M3 family metallopeptidase [Gammaproteobacteria bacterium]NND38845.1 M3 family metallopeptidase [Pseudomonadales bacterium]
MTNPLLADVDCNELPDFTAIDAAHFKPAIESLIASAQADIDKLLQALQSQAPGWDNLCAPMESALDRLEQAWSVISHLNGVCNTPAVREAHAECQPLLTAFYTSLGQHEGIYKATLTLRDSESYLALDTAQQKVVDNNLRDFKLAGIALDQSGRERYAAIKKRLAEITTTFSNNVLDATRATSKLVAHADELPGLPDSALQAAADLAAAKQQQGYLFTLDIPSYLPLMQYCENRALREEMYRAYVTRASELGPDAGKFDNTALIGEILSLRTELAALLEFANYAELSLATKMASTSEEVLGFLNALADKSVARAREEYAELEQFAQQELGLDTLQAWDVPFASEKLRVARYAISQEELRAWFPIDRVLPGMFDIVQRLYGLQIREAKSPGSWHSDARFFELFDATGEQRASFYIDLYAREGKRGGAWMADCKSRRRLPGDVLQRPVAFLVCNFTPPAAGQPALLTHNEVTTLFHEFGHGLHHMLTTIDYAPVAGINGVPWDAVELPSQFMENWCWEREALAVFARHHQSGEILPDAMLKKMLDAKNFQSAMQMARQLEFALFDFRIHMECSSENWRGIDAVLAEVRQQVAAYAVPEFNRFAHSFSHIFAGGYAAGYYSYKWAEVLSADAFSLFEERGIFDLETGRRFYESVLSQGGSREPAELFAEFRGRAASTDALLRHSGIAA